MNSEKFIGKLVDSDCDTNFCVAKGKRVLLIGVIQGEPTLRKGVTEETWENFGEHYDDNVTGFRFFDSSENRLYDVPKDFLKAFMSRNQVINARMHFSRPFIITMLDGGRVQDLPVLSATSLNVMRNDVFIIDRSIAKYPIVVNGLGKWAQIKDTKVIDLRTENIIRFYNL